MVNYVDLEIELDQRASAFETEQTAANYGRAALGGGIRGNPLAVIERAKSEDTRLEAAIGQRQPVERRDKRMAAGRDD